MNKNSLYRISFMIGALAALPFLAWSKFQTGSCEPTYKTYALTATSSNKGGIAVTYSFPATLWIRGFGPGVVRGAFFDSDRTDLALLRDLKK